VPVLLRGEMMRLLIVEDEKGLNEAIRAILEKNGYVTDAAFDGTDGLDFALSGIYDLILLDIMLPKISGLSILKELRQRGHTVPVLLLTAKSEVEDKIKGLDTGADDYLTKPFDTGELLARVRALSRRKGGIVDDELRYGDIGLRRSTQELIKGTSSIRLGFKEFQLLEILILNKNQIVLKDTLCEKVWGPDDSSEYNNVEVYISFLRKKLSRLHSAVTIKSARNLGYTMEGEVND
jgi:DNA-binding response OmpR family regulator